MNDSNKGSNGPAGSRSGKLHSERGVGTRAVTVTVMTPTGGLGLRSVDTPRISIGPAGYRSNRD